jgi:hypothetical protein
VGPASTMVANALATASSTAGPAPLETARTPWG